ncbi:hypothetical protein K8R33_00445, partial [archaeon]|nr:hypothetical protein [archaeon]
MANKTGRKFTPIIENQLYSSLIFSIANGNSYPKKIAESLNKDFGNISRQLTLLEKKGFALSKLEGSKNVFPFERKVYSIKWERIIQEFIDFLTRSIAYLKEEDNRIGLNLKENYESRRNKKFEEIINKIENKNYQKKLKENKYLIKYFQVFFSEIARLKDNWDIRSIFDYIVFFGKFNFIKMWYSADYIYNIEQIIQPKTKFPSLGKDIENMSKKDKEKELKKINEQLKKEGWKEKQKKVDEELDKFRENDKHLHQLEELDNIIELARIKPSLDIGLTTAQRKVGRISIMSNFQEEKVLEHLKQVKKNALSIHDIKEADLEMKH